MGEPWRGEVSFVSAEALVNSRVDGLLQRIIYIHILSGWWFGTFGLFFHSVGKFIIPTVTHSYFSRWLVFHQPVYIYTYYMILPG